MFVEPVPPPHERSWRHPSELAPPPVEPAPRSVRVAATVTGAATIALVGLFALAVTPTAGGDPNAAVVSSSTVATVETGEQVTPTLVSTATEGGGPNVDTSDRRTVVLLSTSRLMDNDVPVDGSTVTVLLSDRLEADANVLLEVGGVLALQLLEADPPNGLDEYVVATSVPGRNDQVVPMASGGKAQPVRLSDIGKKVRLAPGTPVLDANGDLVAICDEHGRPRFLVPDPDSSTTTTTIDPTTTTSTTTTTTVDDTTTTTTSTTSTTTTSTTTTSTTTTSTTTTVPDTTTTTTVDDTTTTTSTSSTTTTTEVDQTSSTNVTETETVTPSVGETATSVERG